MTLHGLPQPKAWLDNVPVYTPDPQEKNVVRSAGASLEWAAQQTGSARWVLPLSFVLSMLVGGLLGFNGVQWPVLEGAISASVLALGLLVAVAARLPIPSV